MLECPHCHQRTISRWRDSLVCPNCNTRIKTSRILRALFIAIPITLSGVVLAYWEPPPSSLVANILIIGACVLGPTLAYTIPRYKEAKT